MYYAMYKGTMKCQKCYKTGDKLKLRWIQLYSGHIYNACIDCRKDLTIKPLYSKATYKMFKFRPDIKQLTWLIDRPIWPWFTGYVAMNKITIPDDLYKSLANIAYERGFDTEYFIIQLLEHDLEVWSKQLSFINKPLDNHK